MRVGVLFSIILCLLEWPLRCWSAFCISHAQRLTSSSVQCPFPCSQALAFQTSLKAKPPT